MPLANTLLSNTSINLHFKISLAYPSVVFENSINTLSCPVVKGLDGAVVNVTLPSVVFTEYPDCTSVSFTYTLSTEFIFVASNTYSVEVPSAKNEFFLFGCNTFTSS